MATPVDFLIIAGDSSVDFLTNLTSIGEDVRKISYSMYDFHSFLGMRTLGPYKAAWAAREHGYTVQVISKIQLIDLEELISLCEEFMDKDTVIGLGTSLLIYPFENYTKEGFENNLSKKSVLYKMLTVIEHFRSKYNSKVIVGGAQAIAFQDITKADHVIQGESENKLPQLLDKVKRKGIQKRPYNWQITDCYFKWHPNDFIVNKEPLPLETSRGCIFRCKFCRFENIGKKKGTFERSLQCVREELIDNYIKYGTTHYWIADDTFNDNDARVNEFCELVESLPFKISFIGYIRLDLAHHYQDTTRRLYRAGLVGCSLGMESFHPEAAQAVGKAFSAKHGREFLDYFYHDICERNIVMNTCHIIGLPGETSQSLQKTINWYMKRPHIHINWSALALSDPKRIPPEQVTSEFERNAEEYGYKFFDDKPRTYWERGEMNSLLARSIRQDVFRQTKRHNIVAGEPWTSLHYLSILGLTPKEARETGWLTLYNEKTHIIRAHNMRYLELLKKSINYGS